MMSLRGVAFAVTKPIVDTCNAQELQAAPPRATKSAHQQRGESPRRTEHWLSVAEGSCVVERGGGEQPEANDQSIIKKSHCSGLF